MPHRRLYSPGPEGIAKAKRLWIEPLDREEFIVGQAEKILLTLRSHVAQNIYNILRRKIVDDEFHDGDLNCHTTAAIALGEARKISWGSAKPRGKKIDVQEALATVPLPCGMQIHSHSHWEYILHSAILLGPAVDAPPLVFHKNGDDPMELCTLERVLSAYEPHKEDLTFYGDSHVLPGRWRKFLQWLSSFKIF